MEWWTSGEIKEYQNRQFLQIVRHAYDTVPFYKKLYDKHGVQINQICSLADLKKLPIVTKKMVRNSQNTMISNSYKMKTLKKGLTSGTSGTPLTVYSTSEGLAFQWAVWWRHKARFGISLKDKHLTFGARVPIAQTHGSPPYWRNDYFNNRVYLSASHVSKNTVKDIVKYLNSVQFDFFTGYPSAMYVLASLIEREGLCLKKTPKYIVCGSDALTPKYEATISRVFDANVTEQYGMVEFAGNLSKCECGVFHEDFECGYTETLACEDTTLESLILTGWGNRAMPFIRYEIGDLVKRSKEACSCGRSSRSYARLEGRLEDFIVTRDGRKLIGMNQVLEYATNAQEAQIHQRSAGEIEFRIIPGDGFGEDDRVALVREFRRRGGEEIKIKIKIVDELERSSAGKVKAVISEIDDSNRYQSDL